MNRKAIYVIVFLLVLVGSFSAWQIWLYLNPLVIKEDFESGFGQWLADADVPLDPNVPGQPVAWNITRSTDVVYSGQYAVRLFIDGSQDDGTIWLERKITASKNAQVSVTMSFWLFSEHESFNTIAAVVAFAGVRNPEEESDFEVLGAANQVSGWMQYKFEATVNTEDNGEAWVAFGVSVQWETVMAYYVDSVEITVR
ncbi:hypothetical protein KEJ18_04750 [Candidatus Bathyarchaeota archaeon]|nr:hypothetical protein [Candidatus Bathyarchaeota archaeon]